MKYRKTNCGDYAQHIFRFTATGFIGTVMAILVAANIQSAKGGDFSVELDIRALLFLTTALGGVSFMLSSSNPR